MRNSRIPFAAAIAGLAAIVSGAFITSTKVALQPDQPEPGSSVHRAIALLAIGLLCAAGVAARKEIGLWTALASFTASAAIGRNPPLSPGSAVWHAALSHLFTAAIAATLVMALPGWNKPCVTLDAGSWKGLRPAAMAAPVAVFGQILMGALYRHQVAGIMPHMLGAMIVALLTMVVSAIVLQHFSESKELKRTATLLISAVLLQVCLGITVFIMLLLNASDTTAFVWIATGHVTTGTLVLAASVIMALEASRRISVAK